MALSVAKPRKRTETEVVEAFESFKLAWKLALDHHYGKQHVNLRRKWILDVFGNQKNLMNYFRTGTLSGPRSCDPQE